MVALMILIYSAVLFAAGYYFRQHTAESTMQDRQAARLTMLDKL